MASTLTVSVPAGNFLRGSAEVSESDKPIASLPLASKSSRLSSARAKGVADPPFESVAIRTSARLESDLSLESRASSRASRVLEPALLSKACDSSNEPIPRASASGFESTELALSRSTVQTRRCLKVGSEKPLASSTCPTDTRSTVALGGGAVIAGSAGSGAKGVGEAAAAVLTTRLSSAPGGASPASAALALVAVSCFSRASSMARSASSARTLTTSVPTMLSGAVRPVRDLGGVKVSFSTFSTTSASSSSISSRLTDAFPSATGVVRVPPSVANSVKVTLESSCVSESIASITAPRVLVPGTSEKSTCRPRSALPAEGETGADLAESAPSKSNSTKTLSLPRGSE
ncbi:hypothetical protein T492DRAFT_968169 [Pavlovales sp. CCMP2436]|nr:hypothetical protein T492DRAFT_968169 [Pavlovales sp. CCMP2436]